MTGKPSDELYELFDDYFNNTNLDFLYEYTYNSSVVNHMEGLNKNNAAVFIANALGDSLFTPNQFLDFFTDSLTVSSKHLEFAPGDHAGPELEGLLGLPDAVWTRAGEWMDFYLLDDHSVDEFPLTNTAIAGSVKGDTAPLPKIVLTVMDGDVVESYDSWDEVTTDSTTYHLSGKEELRIAPSVAADANTPLAVLSTGENANITGGVVLITATIDALVDVQTRFDMNAISREYGAVFKTVSAVGGSSSVKYRGVPTLKLKVIPYVVSSDSGDISSTNGTVVVYLLGVNPLTNEGHLFSFSPWTFKGVPALLDGVDLDTVDLEAVTTTLESPITVSLYDIPAHYHLALVVASQDRPLYMNQNPDLSRISVMQGSTISMPLHD